MINFHVHIKCQISVGVSPFCYSSLIFVHHLPPSPSLSQMSLLLHTFKQEPKMWNSEEYTLYTSCAPCEIYDTKLKGSIYFHHFVGKNFLYTAVVAFRK